MNTRALLIAPGIGFARLVRESPTNARPIKNNVFAIGGVSIMPAVGPLYAE